MALTMAQHIAAATAKIKNRTVPNANLAGGLVEGDLVGGVSKADVGLGNVANYPLASSSDVLAGTRIDRYVTCDLIPSALNKAYTKQDLGLSGSVLYGDGTEGAVNLVYDTYVKPTLIVSSDADIAAAQNVKQSMDTVFDEWYRFSHQADLLPQPFNPAELNEWSYDSVTDIVKCTINSVTHIGFVNKTKYSDYTFECELSSIGADDDSIALVIGWAEVDGKEYTLIARRSQGGMGATWQISYQYQWNTGSGRWDVATGDAYAFIGGWAAKTVKIKVVRAGDVFTCYTTENNSSVYTGTVLTVDLNSDPRLAKFKGGCGFGFSCYSQEHSSWKVLKRPGTFADFLDARTMEVHRHDGTNWVISDYDAVPEALPKNRLYVNKDTRTLYYMPLTGEVIKLKNWTSGNVLGNIQDI